MRLPLCYAEALKHSRTGKPSSAVLKKLRAAALAEFFVFDPIKWVYQLRPGVKPKEALKHVSDHGVCPHCHLRSLTTGCCLQCGKRPDEVKKPYSGPQEIP